MQFKMTENNTWVINGFREIIMIAFDNDDNPHILNEGLLEIDELDGSLYDSDGDEKKLLVKFQNNTISFETLPEDYDFWKGTENCNKQGCLGYVEEILNELKDFKNCEYDIESTKQSYISKAIGILRHIDYVKQKYPELFSFKEKQSHIKYK